MDAHYWVRELIHEVLSATDLVEHQHPEDFLQLYIRVLDKIFSQEDEADGTPLEDIISETFHVNVQKLLGITYTLNEFLCDRDWYYQDILDPAENVFSNFVLSNLTHFRTWWENNPT